MTLALLAFTPHTRRFPPCAVIASLGALAFGFEFLHGTLPLLLAVILGSLALRSYEHDRPITLGKAPWVVLAYSTGVTRAATVKLLAVAITAGPENLPAYFGQLSLRMAGGNASHFDALRSLFGNLVTIARGSAALGVAAVVLASVATCTSVAKLARRRVDHPRASGAVLLLMASMMVIAVWYALFRNHTALHGGFMVRLSVWPIAVGPLCWLLTWRESNGAEPSAGMKSMQAPSATARLAAPE